MSNLRKSTRFRKLSTKALDIVPPVSTITQADQKIDYVTNSTINPPHSPAAASQDVKKSATQINQINQIESEDGLIISEKPTKKRKLDVQSDEEEVIFESDFDLESDLSDYEDLVPNFTKLENEHKRKQMEIDPIEKLLVYKNNNYNEFFLDQEINQENDEKLKKSIENENENSIENINFLKLVDENLKLSTNIYPNNENFIKNIKNYENESLFNYLNNSTNYKNLNNMKFNKIKLNFWNNYKQINHDEKIDYSNAPLSNFDEYVSYDDDEHSNIPNIPSTAISTTNKNIEKFEYRLYDNLNLALPQVSSSPNYSKTVNCFMQNFENVKNKNIYNILNKSSILTGKAGEMVCTGVVLNEFLL